MKRLVARHDTITIPMIY